MNEAKGLLDIVNNLGPNPRRNGKPPKGVSILTCVSTYTLSLTPLDFLKFLALVLQRCYFILVPSYYSGYAFSGLFIYFFLSFPYMLPSTLFLSHLILLHHFSYHPSADTSKTFSLGCSCLLLFAYEIHTTQF